MEKKDEQQRLVSRRDFLAGLRKWSAAVIGVAAGGAVLLSGEETAGWVNHRGSWVNGAGAGGWINRRTTWVNGAGGGGAAWVNRAGGGGGAWVNRRGW
jgi:hypothetical protein